MCERCNQRATEDLALIQDLESVLEVNSGGLKDHLEQELKIWKIKATLAQRLTSEEVNPRDVLSTMMRDYPEEMLKILTKDLFGEDDYDDEH